MPAAEELMPVTRLSRDLAKASATLSDREARYLVDLYYQLQDYRIASGNQVRKLAEGYEPQAGATLGRFVRETTAKAWYAQGILPPGHIHARAKRYAVKLFLAHWHHVAYQVHFGTPPPKPYVIEHLGHAHFIAPPNWPS